MGKQDDIRHGITQRIMESLNQGQRPWVRPWSNSPNGGWPTAIGTNKAYRGINPLLLNFTMMTRGYVHKWWGTFNQWKKMGCNVKKRPDDVKAGEWGTGIVYWQFVESKELDDKGKAKRFPMLRAYTVFNIEQVDDTDGKLAKYMIDKTHECHPDYTVAQEVVDATKASISFGANRACYVLPNPYGDWPNHKVGDLIQMPAQGQFVKLADFYYTMFHELGHWSEVRTGWKEEKYAMNELVAEMTACFLAQACSIPESDDLTNHTPYLQHWLKAMGGDDRFILRAASQASKAADHILQYSGRSATHEEETEAQAA